MTTLLLTLLIIIAGAAFAWYRIKTRGVATVLEETRQFIARQNSKDVTAFKGTKRLLPILGRMGDKQARRLHERYHEWYRKQEEESKERAAYLANAKEFFGEPKAGSVTNGYLRNIAPEVERLVSGLTPEQKRLLGELTPEDKKDFQRMCRLHGYPDGDLEYAFVLALEEVDYRRNGRRKPERVTYPDGTVHVVDAHRAGRYRYDLSEAFDTAGWKARLKASGRARSAVTNSLRRSERTRAAAQAKQTRRESVTSSGTASSGSWLNSPWVWLLGAYWLGQQNQKMQQQQRRNEPDFSKYPYTMDGRTWNPYKKRYERR